LTCVERDDFLLLPFLFTLLKRQNVFIINVFSFVTKPTYKTGLTLCWICCSSCIVYSKFHHNLVTLLIFIVIMHNAPIYYYYYYFVFCIWYVFGARHKQFECSTSVLISRTNEWSLLKIQIERIHDKPCNVSTNKFNYTV
jgi:hypothetical protein